MVGQEVKTQQLSMRLYLTNRMQEKHNINTANKSFESVAEFKYMRTKLANKIACMKKPRTN